MKFTRRHLKICIQEGFSRAWLQDDGGGVETLFADLDDDGYTTMVIKPDMRAWMLIGPRRMKSPKHITESWTGGHRPVRQFRTVREAARHATNGMYY